MRTPPPPSRSDTPHPATPERAGAGEAAPDDARAAGEHRGDQEPSAPAPPSWLTITDPPRV